MLQNKGILTLVALAALAVVYALYRSFIVAAIDISSEPTRAMVSLDGRRLGVTPLKVDVPTGVHLLEIQHSFYRVHSERIDFSRGQSLYRDLILEPGQGTLQVLSNPRGAWVDVDGERQPGITPLLLTLPSGPHEILVGQAERKVAGEMVEILADQTIEINLELQIQPHGSLVVAAQPETATIELAGSSLAYSPNMRLPVGEYGITVSQAGYLPQSFRFVVKSGDNRRVVSLAREFAPLTVAVAPSNADVRVSYIEQGVQESKSYTPGMQVPVGKVEVRARAMLYRTEMQTVELDKAGKTINFSLKEMNVKAGGSMRDTLEDNQQGPELIVIPAGSFVMGRDDGPPSEQPAHRVTITQPFAIGKYEVTVEDYLLFAQASGRSYDPRMDATNARYPATMVSWDDAKTYVDWLSKQSGAQYRLPTEAEWEYAARGGSNSLYSFGNTPEGICEHANLADQSTREIYRDWQVVDCDDGASRLAAVGSRKANGFGLYDVSGNVSEWVQECGMPNYENAPNDGSKARNKGCESHSFRGGSWDSIPDELRMAYRNTGSSRNQDRGFRVVRDL